MRKSCRALAAGDGELFLDKSHKVAYGVHGFELGGLELDLEVGFNRNDEIDVVEGVPFGDAGGGQLGGEDEGVVVEDVVENAGEFGVDLLLLHGFSIARVKGVLGCVGS